MIPIDCAVIRIKLINTTEVVKTIHRQTHQWNQTDSHAKILIDLAHGPQFTDPWFREKAATVGHLVQYILKVFKNMHTI